MMLLQHQPPALDRAGRSIGPLVWVTVVLGVTLAAGVARGQVPRRAKRAIDARQAVRIAERFVRENGYTDFIPDDPRRLVPESIEFSRNRRDWLKARHNELKPQAVGYRNGSRNDQPTRHLQSGGRSPWTRGVDASGSSTWTSISGALSPGRIDTGARALSEL
jgi:hypothetical protein